jgi:hypothetical protein
MTTPAEREKLYAGWVSRAHLERRAYPQSFTAEAGDRLLARCHELEAALVETDADRMRVVSENAALRADKERLDWLSQRRVIVADRDGDVFVADGFIDGPAELRAETDIARQP